MAYATAEMNIAISLPGGAGGSLWLYINSAEDAVATVRGTDYVDDAEDKGMKVGDLIVSCGAAGVGQVYKCDAIDADGNGTLT